MPVIVWACPRCSRWLTDTNAPIGNWCAGCIEDDNREWAEQAPVAYFPVGHPTFCAGCGHQTETPGMDLCWRCGDNDPYRTVNA